MSQRKWVRRCLGWVARGLAAVVLLVVAVLLVFRFANPPTTAFMLAHQWQPGSQSLRHQWVPLAQMSPWLPRAVMASEDQRFASHWGLDTEAIATALREYRRGEGLRGASTITQQTVKNLFLWEGRSLARKALEAGLAVAVELLWPKRRIMEVYLNVAEFGPGIYGVEAASRAHFGIGAGAVGPTQAARLAAVLPSPKRLDAGNPSPYVWQRVAWIRQQMQYVAPLP
ncbi:MAG: monofunctional biosynthetic peptidoglycan transglycosylase [Marinobacter sp.]|uniref:monofunctional biosynthetic peptidoglycan transglycosylase n=1 Tax=Marinobacter sp. TaxID=50741 RepID=UPI00299DE885|nr:monofunctional biosynthetic peptidoglycan transglycosylase [Marinobacter sp.]MDX1635235.1 monofunctional biosynthetic peptidoglycan transglycosylase [Marinobacter sp.]